MTLIPSPLGPATDLAEAVFGSRLMFDRNPSSPDEAVRMVKDYFRKRLEQLAPVGVFPTPNGFVIQMRDGSQVLLAPPAAEQDIRGTMAPIAQAMPFAHVPEPAKPKRALRPAKVQPQSEPYVPPIPAAPHGGDMQHNIPYDPNYWNAKNGAIAITGNTQPPPGSLDYANMPQQAPVSMTQPQPIIDYTKDKAYDPLNRR